MKSTGIKFLGEGEWRCKKHEAEYRRQWPKLHIGIDVQHTMQIRAIGVTSNNVSDAAVLADLLERLSKDDSLESITGDGAYDTKQIYEAVTEHAATPTNHSSSKKCMNTQGQSLCTSQCSDCRV